MIKMIGFDLDGTLLNSKGGVNKNTIEAIRAARKYNVKIIINTGRSIGRVEEISRSIDGYKFDDYIVTLNGAKIFKFSDDNLTEVVSKPFSEDQIKEIFKKAKDLKLKIFAYGVSGKKSFTNKKGSIIAIGMSKYNKLPLSKYDGTTLPTELFSKMIIRGSSKNITTFKKFLTKKEYIFTSASYPKTNPKILEVTAPGIDKLYALKMIAKEFGIKQSEIAYFGDGENDISSLKWVGSSFAMAEAPDQIKEVSKFRVEQGEGITEAILKFVEEHVDESHASNTILSDEAAPESKD
ncbi:HAD superfamily hydrolase [Spiroplasma sp. TIUS-1]|uniref:HAD family hydrolase n=1 Tax=Spiroplasma sp. TIUS-1 TaxID=216963 RepID=UPI0013975E0C|nr:HAD family hydrolase [Spiroplasma sp. TIUS-1]QHX35665.1 HAD superfamily hydrolase [Spiroplasma sp. TIUS-1]